MRRAQSAERVARAISQFAPHHNESDATRTKCREGCASDITVRTAPQRERSDTHTVTRGLAQAHVRFSQNNAHSTKNEH